MTRNDSRAPLAAGYVQLGRLAAVDPPRVSLDLLGAEFELPAVAWPAGVPLVAGGEVALTFRADGSAVIVAVLTSIVPPPATPPA